MGLRSWIRARMNTDLSNNRILVYQMGKVGSVSMQVSLRRLGFKTNHAHYLWMTHRGEYNTNKPGLVKNILKRDRQWTVVSLVREPIARNISAFFQRIEKYYPTYKTWEYKPDMVDAFLDAYEQFWPLIWYDLEMLPLFQLDIYAHEFDHTKGYTIYKNANVNLLILRLEDMDRVIGQAFKEFVGLRGVKPALSNYTTNKSRVAQMYTDFKEKSRFPKEYLDWMYDSRYAKYFYTQEELMNFRSRWGYGDD